MTILGTRITKSEIGFSRAPGASLYFSALRVHRVVGAAIALRSNVPDLLEQEFAE
ncbi:hypothetical protein [Burkholderia pyrrocinia]|uniref:hypothetical protein n=1 Tax=Burkholderia pyrrocinia TaxID=60550 RepID=UPI001374A3E5|nr:hypothetical protein [Burkholderia pyrrocinia]